MGLDTSIKRVGVITDPHAFLKSNLSHLAHYENNPRWVERHREVYLARIAWARELIEKQNDNNQLPAIGPDHGPQAPNEN